MGARGPDSARRRPAPPGGSSSASATTLPTAKSAGRRTSTWRGSSDSHIHESRFVENFPSSAVRTFTLSGGNVARRRLDLLAPEHLGDERELASSPDDDRHSKRWPASSGWSRSHMNALVRSCDVGGDRDGLLLPLALALHRDVAWPFDAVEARAVLVEVADLVRACRSEPRGERRRASQYETRCSRMSMNPASPCVFAWKITGHTSPSGSPTVIRPSPVGRFR